MKLLKLFLKTSEQRHRNAIKRVVNILIAFENTISLSSSSLIASAHALIVSVDPLIAFGNAIILFANSLIAPTRTLRGRVFIHCPRRGHTMLNRG